MTQYPEYAAESLEMHREHHRAHVAQGNCPSVDWTKNWCNLKADHASSHRAAGLRPTGGAVWGDVDAHACPCTEPNK